jgi:hypothetical protein
MNGRIANKSKGRKLFYSLFAFCIFFVGMNSTLLAQWTFTPQIQNSGCSSAATAQQYMTQLNTQLSSIFTGLGLPSKSMCESLRQQVLAIRFSSPEYDNKGKYIGECAVFYTCSSCTGSDVFVPGQSSPDFNQTVSGNVSIDGLIQGTSFFSSHSSKEIEDWSQEYMQKLESLGLIEQSGVFKNQLKIPTSGDKEFDKFYLDQIIRFEKPEQGGVVDLSGKIGVVDLKSQQGNSGNTVKISTVPDENNSLKASEVPPLIPGVIKEDPKHEYIDFTRESLVSLAGLAPKPFSYLGIAITDIYAADATQLIDCLNGNCKPTSTVLVNMASQFATDASVQGLGDIGGAVTGKLFSNLALKNGNLLKGADLGFSEFRKGVAEEVIPQIGEGHFGLVSGVTDLAKKWVNAAGIQTIYDDSK